MCRLPSAKPPRPPYTRKRDAGGWHTNNTRAYNWCGGASPPGFASSWNELGQRGYEGWYVSSTDRVTPGYKKLIADGAIINNGRSRVSIKGTPYLLNGRQVRQVKGTYATLSGISGYRWAAYDLYGDWHSLLFGSNCNGFHTDLKTLYPLPVSTQALYNSAAIQAFNRVNPASSQSLVTALEAHKTLDMISDRAMKIAKVIQACKSGNTRLLDIMFPNKRTTRYPKRVVVWDDAGRPIVGKSGVTAARYGHLPQKATPSKMEQSQRLWLEYRYGWTPLVHDIVDTLKAMYADDLRKELIQRERFIARGKASHKGVITSAQSSSINWAFGTVSALTEADHDYTVRAYILYKLSGDRLLRRLNDFGAFDVPKAIWEITPWSFVLDWFIPIGDFLGALTPKVGVEILASGYTVDYTLKVKRTVSGWVSNPATGDLAWDQSPIPIGGADLVEMTESSRYPHLSFPTFPPIEVKLNLKRMVDAVALSRALR